MRIRLRFVLAALACVVVAPLLAWWLSGSEAAERMAQRIELTAESDRASQERELATRLALRLEALRATESRRPWHEYQSLHHDPDWITQGIALAPSPIANGPEDPLIAGYFSIKPDGEAWYSGGSRERVTSIARRVLAHPPPCRGATTQLDAQAVFQNARAPVLAEQVLRNVAAQLPSPSPVELTQSPLSPTEVGSGHNLALVAVRCVVIEGATTYQGYVIWRDTAQEWLRQATGARVTLRGSGSRIARVPVEGVTWSVILPDDEMPDAMRRASSVVSDFRRRFARGAAVLLGGTGMLAALLLQADRLARKRVEFATAAAHELRTPLASLQLQTELLAEGAKDDDTRERASRLAREVARLGRVVANVLDATRVERAGAGVRTEPGDLAAAVRSMVEDHAPLLESAGMGVTFESDRELPPALFDGDAMGHVLGNLLDNAERHSRGSASRRVRVEVRRAEAGWQRVVVSDAGPGVPRSRRQAIFRRFARGSDVSRGGLGLGLPLARSLARAQGGDLTCEPCETGARFVLTVREA